MRRSTLKLYGPFLALAAVQALFIVAAPSKAPDKQQLSAGTGAFKSGNAAANGFSSTGANGTTDVASGGGGAGGGAGGGGGGGGSARRWRRQCHDDGAELAAGDTSHCVGQYQFDVLLTHGPPCQPAFGGDNGGATYQGVDAQTIKIIYFESTPNEQVNAILGAKGLATSSAEEDAAIAAYQDFINKHYELWGRHVEIKKVIGDCPTTPPDYDKCGSRRRRWSTKHPFAVIWVTSLYADVFTIWANAGIVSIGGSAFDQSYYNDFRPFRYDVAMDGTQSADFISEYYCKKLVGKHPDHAGQVIHATIGTRTLSCASSASSSPRSRPTRSPRNG